MKGFLAMGCGLISSLLLTTAVSAGNQAPLQDVQAAHGKVVAIKSHLSRLIGGGGGGNNGGGGGEQPTSCGRIREPRECFAKGCRWVNDFERGRCVNRNGDGHGDGNDGGHGGWRPGFHGENDVAAQLAATGMTLGMEKLADAIFQMTVHYYDASYWNYWTNACHGSKKLLIANQGAKLAAALPQVGYFKPQYFEMYDHELVQIRQLIWCN